MGLTAWRARRSHSAEASDAGSVRRTILASVLLVVLWRFAGRFKPMNIQHANIVLVDDQPELSAAYYQ